MKNLFELPEIFTLSGTRLDAADENLDVVVIGNNHCTSGSGTDNGCKGGSGDGGNGCGAGSAEIARTL